MESLPFWPNV